MKTAVVAVINFMENGLEQRTVQVADSASWQDAYMAAFVVGTDMNDDKEFVDWIYDLSSNLEEAAPDLLDGEMSIKVIFLPCE